jgi:hypothetical protein
MRHTIVIELPDDADPSAVEDQVTRRIEHTLANPSAPGVSSGSLRVVEYHYEQMTTTEENP